MFREQQAGQAAGVDLPEIGKLDWVHIAETTASKLVTPSELGEGEIGVLNLATIRPKSLVILDDGPARSYANLLQLRTTGTCGVLLRAKRENQIQEVKPILNLLEDLGFRLSPQTRSEVLRLAGESID